MALEAVVNGKKKKKERKGGETLRLELELVLTSDEQSNEFFYPTLVEERTEKQNSSEGTESGPFGEDPNEQEKLAAIARSFEEKYGPGPKKKKRKLQDLDLIDKGYGYDISDSFVDDSELYEDFVPPQVETALGGFYINTGQLDFKCRTDLDPEEADFVLKKKKPKLKKNLSHQKILANQKLKKAKQTAFHKTPVKSGKKLLAGPGVSPLVKQAKIKPEKKLKKSKLTVLSSPSKFITSEDSTSVSTLAVPIGVGGITVPVFDPANSTLSKVDTSSLSALPTSGPLDATGQGEEQADKPPPPPKEPPILPESLLPSDVLAKVKDLEETIRWDQGNGKKLSVKTRSGYDEKLVEIELLCKALNMKIRNAVFEFLAYKMGVAKGTLTKRMKAVLKKREDDKLEEPLRRLKLAVEESMPAQIADHEEARRTESVSSVSDRVLDTEDETSRMEDVFDDSALGSSQVGVGGVIQPGTPLSSSQEGGPGKIKKTLIRKKYKWNEEIRKLLCDVVRIKVESEERISRITRGNGEEIISIFLEEKVRPFWPKGWMQKSVLMKMSEVAHKHFTNPQTKKAVVLKKEKPTVVKKEPVDPKPAATLPTLSTALVATVVSSSISAPSLSQVTTAATSTSAPSTSSRRSIPSDPKELLAFLLKDDNSDLLKTVVLNHSAKLVGEKQGSTVQLATKPHPTSSVVATKSTKLHSTKPVMVAQSAKPHSAVTVGVVQSVNKPRVMNTVAASTVSAIKSPELKSSPPRKTNNTRIANTTAPSVVQSSLLKTGASSGLSGPVARVTVPSPPKAEKKQDKKKKLSKDSLSLSTTLKNTASAVTNAALKIATNYNPSHSLTTSGLLQYFVSGGGAPLIQVISKAPAASTSQPQPPSTPATTAIITTSDGRLLLTGASQQQISVTQAASLSSGKSVPTQSPQGTGSGGMEAGITSLLKSGSSVDTASSKTVVSGALPSSSRQQQTSLKTTPVIHIPRVSLSPSSKPASSSNTIVSVSSSTLPPPPLASIASTKHSILSEISALQDPHTQPKQTVVASQPLKPLKLETVLATGQQQAQDNDMHKKATIVVNNSQQTVLKTVTTVPLSKPQSVIPLTSGTTIPQVTSKPAPDSFPIVPSPPKLVSSSKQVGRPLVQQLPLAGATHNTTIASITAKDLLPPTTSDSNKVVPETPPQSSTPWKESSPLKSPVEQIMEEHSYLGSSHGPPQVQPGQSPWQLHLLHTSSPQQSGENALQTQQVTKGPGTHPQDQ